MKPRSFFRGLFWLLVALVFVFHVAGGWYFSDVLIADGFEPEPDSIELVSGDFVIEEVTYTSSLGQFDAWLLPSSGRTWVIHVHGKGASPAEAEHLFASLQEAGYPQLAITYRNDDGQAPDPSGYYRYGATEWEDVAGAVAYANENGAERIVLFGFDTGGSHILSYAYRNALDQLKGIILDAGNIDFSNTVDYGASQREVPLLPMTVPPTLSWTAKFITSLRIGVNWKSIDYVSRADPALRVPILLIHGSDDGSVPVSQSVRLAETVPERARLVVFDGAGHVDSHESDPDRYLTEVLGFIRGVD